MNTRVALVAYIYIYRIDLRLFELFEIINNLIEYLHTNTPNSYRFFLNYNNSFIVEEKEKLFEITDQPKRPRAEFVTLIVVRFTSKILYFSFSISHFSLKKNFFR